jgi:hypothetical protein
MLIMGTGMKQSSLSIKMEKEEEKKLEQLTSTLPSLLTACSRVGMVELSHVY